MQDPLQEVTWIFQVNSAHLDWLVINACYQILVLIETMIYVPGQVEDVIASDTIQFKEPSSPHDKDDTALIVAPQENQDAVPVASPIEHDSAPTSTQDSMNADNMDSAVTMVLDNCNAAAVMALEDKCDAGLTVGSNVELSGELLLLP